MFVVFEGIDGSGKTTLSNRVARRLRDAGLSVAHLREGGKFTSAVTQAIREFGRDARNLELGPYAEFFLYVARDVQLLDEMTRPALGRTDVVIADRFLHSAEVLARFGRGLPDEWLRPVLEAAARGLAPDLVVLVDVDPHVARARRQVAKGLALERRPPSRKGLAGVGIQHRMRAGYQELAAREPGRWVVVDNDGDLDATVERIVTLLAGAARDGVPAALGRWVSPRREPRGLPGPRPTVEDALAAFLLWIDERALREPEVAAYFLAGLWGPGIDERRRLLAERAPDTLLAGLPRLDDEVSWQLREALIERTPGRVAWSLSGLAGVHPRARRLRDRLRKPAPAEVLVSIDGVDDEPAWRLREELYPAAPDLAAGSTMRIATAQAWAVRERWLAERGGLPALAGYETARIACKSVTAVDDERAWKLREQARGTAPIAALASLASLTSDRAWEWRETWLERAPRTVFATVRRSDDPRAWQMRERLAHTCKEAIDSLQDLDGPRAWALRERCADLWPSTVVKTLGPLARSARGSELTERQLRRYPDNVSLLKHAAAIAVGAWLPAETMRGGTMTDGTCSTEETRSR
jgi:dTMP kinase